MALSKLKYIMSTTSDQSLAASCAKVILDKSEAIMKNHDKKEEQVGGVRFNIQVENVYTGGATPASQEPVIIPIDAEDMDESLTEKEKLSKALDNEIKDKKSKLSELKRKTGDEQVNPATGLPYIIAYEGVDNYNDPDTLSAKSKAGLKKNEGEEEWL
jgi:hypothetical protein